MIAAASSASTPAFSQIEFKVRGEVVKIDAAARSITIKPREEAAVTIILNNGASLSKVKAGDQVEVKYLSKDGINSATKVRKIVDGCS
jgi:Cu/Ag efflux protein CusF